MNSTIEELNIVSEAYINKILDIAKENNFITLKEADLKYYIESKYNKIFLATSDDILLGFVIFSHIEDEIDIIDIAVNKKYQNKSIGSIIIDYIKNYTKQNTSKSITLDLDERNNIAYNFYKKNGFKQIAVRKKYYDNKYNAIIMSLNI